MKNKFKHSIILGITTLGIVWGMIGCASNSTVAAPCDSERDVLSEYMIGAGFEYESTLMCDLSERYNVSFDDIRIYDSNDLSLNTIEARDDELIIERCYGMVVTPERDGKVLNPYDENYDYISYKRCSDIREGTRMLTYLVYNPDTQYCDDITERYDCVVSREFED